jgi:hypothetical protein
MRSAEALQRRRARRERKVESAIAKSAPSKPIPNQTGKVGTGTGLMVIGLVLVLLPGLESVPPETTAELTIVPTASAAMVAVTEMSG